VGPGEVLLIGIACIVAVMPVAAAFGAWLRRRRSPTQRRKAAKSQRQ
jgi:hypothetical protein